MKSRKERAESYLKILTLYAYSLAILALIMGWRKMVSDDIAVIIVLCAFLIRGYQFGIKALILSLPETKEIGATNREE